MVRDILYPYHARRHHTGVAVVSVEIRVEPSTLRVQLAPRPPLIVGRLRRGLNAHKGHLASYVKKSVALGLIPKRNPRTPVELEQAGVLWYN